MSLLCLFGLYDNFSHKIGWWNSLPLKIGYCQYIEREYKHSDYLFNYTSNIDKILGIQK